MATPPWPRALPWLSPAVPLGGIHEGSVPLSDAAFFEGLAL